MTYLMCLRVERREKGTRVAFRSLGSELKWTVLATNEKSMCRRSKFSEQDESGEKKMSTQACGRPR